MTSLFLNRDSPIDRGRQLERFTLGWNLFEAVVAISAAVLAGSTALLGFGMDSLVESLSAGVVLWRLRKEGDDGEQRDQQAQRGVGVTLLVLAAYVSYEAVEHLRDGREAELSYVGIALASASLLVMPILAAAKRRVASQLQSEALYADSRQTDFCAYLSAILLAGLGLQAGLGWWWADPVAALIMVPIIAWEGVGHLRNRPCCCG